MTKTGKKNYPFGLTTLPRRFRTEAAAINAEAERLLDTHDAVADLALSEGVYQAVLGNYDRVAATYDAYARGNFPPEPDVVRTPLPASASRIVSRSISKAEADPTVSPVAGVAMTPRAQGEPGLNEWIAGVLPPLDRVGCLVRFFEAAAGAMGSARFCFRSSSSSRRICSLSFLKTRGRR